MVVKFVGFGRALHPLRQKSISTTRAICPDLVLFRNIKATKPLAYTILSIKSLCKGNRRGLDLFFGIYEARFS